MLSDALAPAQILLSPILCGGLGLCPGQIGHSVWHFLQRLQQGRETLLNASHALCRAAVSLGVRMEDLGVYEGQSATRSDTAFP